MTVFSGFSHVLHRVVPSTLDSISLKSDKQQDNVIRDIFALVSGYAFIMEDDGTSKSQRLLYGTFEEISKT